MTDEDRKTKTKHIVVRHLRPYKGCGLLREILCHYNVVRRLRPYKGYGLLREILCHYNVGRLCTWEVSSKKTFRRAVKGSLSDQADGGCAVGSTYPYVLFTEWLVMCSPRCNKHHNLTNFQFLYLYRSCVGYRVKFLLSDGRKY